MDINCDLKDHYGYYGGFSVDLRANPIWDWESEDNGEPQET